MGYSSMIETDISQMRSRDGQLKGIMWNVNGLKEMREYIKEITTTLNPDVIALSETKKGQYSRPQLGLGRRPTKL